MATKRVPPRKPLAGLSLLSEQQLSRIVGSGREVGAQLLPATPAERAAATVQPFVDSVRDPDAALPGRPAISPTDPATQPATEIVAGLSYQHSRFNLNLGYVVPTTPLQDYIAPLGLSLTDEVDTKRVIFGIDISF